MRQRLRHSQSSQSDEYLKTCLKEQREGEQGARVCVCGCVCVFACAGACVPKCVRVREVIKDLL